MLTIAKSTVQTATETSPELCVTLSVNKDVSWIEYATHIQIVETGEKVLQQSFSNRDEAVCNYRDRCKERNLLMLLDD